MSKSYHLTVCFLSLLLMACESEGKKLQRLQGDQSGACIDEQVSHRAYIDARYPGGRNPENLRAPLTPVAESLGREWIDAKTKCELAQRDLNRFMR